MSAKRDQAPRRDVIDAVVPVIGEIGERGRQAAYGPAYLQLRSMGAQVIGWPIEDGLRLLPRRFPRSRSAHSRKASCISGCHLVNCQSDCTAKKGDDSDQYFAV